MRKLWTNIKGAKKPLTALIVLLFLMSGILAIRPIHKAMAAGAGYATLYISPADTSLLHPPYDVGSTFHVYVRINNYTHTASWQAKVAYDASMLNATACSYVAAADFVFPIGTYGPIPAAFGSVNGTHDYVMMTAATYGAIEYNKTVKPDAGLMDITFTVMSVPAKGNTFSSFFELYPSDTWVDDTNVEDNALTTIGGTYEMISPVANHLELSPTDITLPLISGDKIVGTSKADFSVDVLMKNISTSDDIILVQWEMYYNNTILNCTNVVLGTFMNNSVVAPYNVLSYWFVDAYDGLSRITFFVMINTNSSTGEWDWIERPNGDGVLATIDFEVIHQPFAPETASFPLELGGVFGEFFVDTSIEYVPYGPPVNATFTLNGFNWQAPVASFTYSPAIVEVNKTTTFDASASIGYRNVDGVLNPDATYIKEYDWDWGDGTTNTTTTPTIDHEYSDFDNYTVTLTVTDYDGLTDSTSKSFLTYEVLDHTVTYDSQTFTVTTVATGHIEKDSIILIQKHMCLYFNITGQTGKIGILNVTIPKALLDAAPQDWMVILRMTPITTANGLTVTPVDAQHTRLSVTFTFESMESIYIFGTSTIPEFPGTTLALAFMFVLAFVAAFSLMVSKKRKK